MLRKITYVLALGAGCGFSWGAVNAAIGAGIGAYAGYTHGVCSEVQKIADEHHCTYGPDPTRGAECSNPCCLQFNCNNYRRFFDNVGSQTENIQYGAKIGAIVGGSVGFALGLCYCIKTNWHSYAYEFVETRAEAPAIIPVSPVTLSDRREAYSPPSENHSPHTISNEFLITDQAESSSSSSMDFSVSSSENISGYVICTSRDAADVVSSSEHLEEEDSHTSAARSVLPFAHSRSGFFSRPISITQSNGFTDDATINQLRK